MYVVLIVRRFAESAHWGTGGALMVKPSRRGCSRCGVGSEARAARHISESPARSTVARNPRSAASSHAPRAGTVCSASLTAGRSQTTHCIPATALVSRKSSPHSKTTEKHIETTNSQDERTPTGASALPDVAQRELSPGPHSQPASRAAFRACRTDTRPVPCRRPAPEPSPFGQRR